MVVTVESRRPSMNDVSRRIIYQKRVERPKEILSGEPYVNNLCTRVMSYCIAAYLDLVARQFVCSRGTSGLM